MTERMSQEWGGGIHFQAFFSQIMTLAGGGFAFTPALHPALSISHQGLVHFSISKLISRQSLSILMRVAPVPSLTGGETEGKNSWPFIIKGCEPALRRWCRLYVFKCFYLSSAWKTFPLHSQDGAITCTPEASLLIIRSEGKILK